MTNKKQELKEKISYLVSECIAIQISQSYEPNQYSFKSSLLSLGMYQHKFVQYLINTDFEVSLLNCIEQLENRNLESAYSYWSELVLSLIHI